MNDKFKQIVAFMKEKGVTIKDLNAYFETIEKADFQLTIDMKYDFWDYIIVLGDVERGSLYVGADVMIINDEKKVLYCKCVLIERNRKRSNYCSIGDYAAIGLKEVEYTDIQKGDKLIFKSENSENSL